MGFGLLNSDLHARVPYRQISPSRTLPHPGLVFPVLGSHSVVTAFQHMVFGCVFLNFVVEFSVSYSSRSFSSVRRLSKEMF